MKKIHKLLITIASILLCIIIVLSGFKYTAVRYIVLDRIDSDRECYVNIEVRDIKWNPFDNDITIRVPSRIGFRKVVRFGIEGGNESVRKIIIGNNVKEVNIGNFAYLTKLRSIKVSMFNDNFSSRNGILYTNDKTELIYCPMNKIVTRITGPSKLHTIGPAAFYNNINLKKITLPKKITKISSSAFYNCENLEKVDMSRCINLHTIERSSFENCTNLEEIILPDKCEIEELGDGLFRNCKKLKKIDIPKTVKTIKKHAFHACISLETVNFLEDSALEIIEDYAFFKSGVKNIILPHTVRSIGELSFAENHNLEMITLSAKLETIGIKAFINCTSLKQISIPSLVEYIEEETFKNCQSLTDVTFAAGISQIKAFAFEGCKSLKSIELPRKLRGLTYGAFKDCTNLENIVFYDEFRFIEGEVFAGCSSLKEIVIPKLVKSLGSKAFKDCNNLSKITINTECKAILYNSFEGCNSLSKIIYLGTKEEWKEVEIYSGNELFRRCEVEYLG